MNLNDQYEKVLVTIEGLYKHISDVDIYHKYGNGIKVELKGGYKSPFRNENNGSFGFFRGTNEICFKDFVLGSGGPVDFVMRMYNLDYTSALAKIVMDFELTDYFLYKKIDNVKNSNKIEKVDRDEIIKSASKFSITRRVRPWKIRDKKFWEPFGISLETLKEYNVEPVDYIFAGDNIIKADSLAYCFTEFKDNVETYKIYQPYSKNYKWVNTHDYSTWQGWTQMPESGEILFITKSLKDVMSIVDILGVPAVSLQAETVMPKESIIEELKSRFERVYLLYDNDFNADENWGQIQANNLREKFKIDSIYIPSGHECKDFSDLVKNKGSEEAIRIIQQELDNLIPF